MMGRAVRFASALLILGIAVGCSRAKTPTTSSGVPLAGPLIPARTTMVTAWDVPKNPLTDPTLDDSRLSKEIRWGFRLFVNTPDEATRFTPSRMSCSNCHLNAGQRERSLPLVAVAAMFPEYNRRSGRLYSLTDRIVDCFLRSENATGNLADGADRVDEDTPSMPTPASREVLAIAAYITWLARGAEVGKNPAWRGQNTMAAAALRPLDTLDPARGEAIFNERCTTCHGQDGQGVMIGDKKPGPLCLVCLPG